MCSSTIVSFLFFKLVSSQKTKVPQGISSASYKHVCGLMLVKYLPEKNQRTCQSKENGLLMQITALVRRPRLAISLLLFPHRPGVSQEVTHGSNHFYSGAPRYQVGCRTRRDSCQRETSARRLRERESEEEWKRERENRGRRAALLLPSGAAHWTH